LAGDTARIRQFSLDMNSNIMALIWNSMSAGWSPTGTLVIPGKSTRVRLSTDDKIENNQLINQASKQVGKQSINLSIHQSLNQSASQSVNQASKQSNNQSANQSIN